MSERPFYLYVIFNDGVPKLYVAPIKRIWTDSEKNNPPIYEFTKYTSPQYVFAAPTGDHLIQDRSQLYPFQIEMINKAVQFGDPFDYKEISLLDMVKPFYSTFTTLASLWTRIQKDSNIAGDDAYTTESALSLKQRDAARDAPAFTYELSYEYDSKTEEDKKNYGPKKKELFNYLCDKLFPHIKPVLEIFYSHFYKQVQNLSIFMYFTSAANAQSPWQIEFKLVDNTIQYSFLYKTNRLKYDRNTDRVVHTSLVNVLSSPVMWKPKYLYDYLDTYEQEIRNFFDLVSIEIIRRWSQYCDQQLDLSSKNENEIDIQDVSTIDSTIDSTINSTNNSQRGESYKRRDATKMLPKQWIELRDINKRVYYYNLETQVSTWDKPKDEDVAELPSKFWISFKNKDGKVIYFDTQTSVKSESVPRKVNDDWIEIKDEHNISYYLFSKTNDMYSFPSLIESNKLSTDMIDKLHIFDHLVLQPVHKTPKIYEEKLNNSAWNVLNKRNDDNGNNDDARRIYKEKLNNLVEKRRQSMKNKIIPPVIVPTESEPSISKASTQGWRNNQHKEEMTNRIAAMSLILETI
jgi:hypothetical protein